MLAITSIGSVSDPLVQRIARRADTKLTAACPQRRSTYQRIIVAPRVLSFVDIGRGLTVASSLATAEVRDGNLYSFEANDDRLTPIIPRREIIATGTAWTSPEEPVIAKKAPVMTAGGVLFALPAILVSSLLVLFWRKADFKRLLRHLASARLRFAAWRQRLSAQA